ncbi:TIGR02391 family protein [Geodermatophilus sp. SYSU D00079]
MGVDASFAQQRFGAYLDLWDRYLNYYNYDQEQDRTELADDIIRAQPTISRLVTACGQRMLARRGTSEDTYKEHRAAVLRAQGYLNDREPLAKALGPQAPQLRADTFHPWVWETAAPLWTSKHYRQAVAAAAGNLSLKVQSKLDRWDVADDALMTEALSEKPPAPGKPRLRVPATPGRPFEEALQTGALFFARGVFSLLRNPATHNVTEVWDEQRALEALAALSVLARTLDAAVVEATD